MKNFKKTFLLLPLLFLLFTAFILPNYVFAQAPVGNNPSATAPSGNNPGATAPAGNTTINVSIPNPLASQSSDLMSFLNTIFNSVIMPVAAVGVVVWIVWAGFQFVLAQGNETKLALARKNLLWSLIGAGILLGAVGISAVVKNTVIQLTT